MPLATCRPTRLLSLALPLCALCATVPASAVVTWTATFEAGDLSEWSPGINATKGDRRNVEVLGEQVYRGMYAGKITVHPDDTFTFGQNRVDIQHPSTLTDEGKELWLTGHYMMPEDAKVRNQIGFFESNVSYQNVMDFWVQPKEGGGTTLHFGVGFLGENELWSGDFTKGVWHQIGIHVLWSTDPAKGSVDVWFDGVQVVTGYKTRTKADGNTLFYQTGLHRREVAQVTDVIYFDEFIEADTMLEAKIAAPTPPGGVGGGGGAGGDAGSAGQSAGAAGAGTGGDGSGAPGGGTGGNAGAASGGAAPGAGSGTTSGGAAGTAGPNPTPATESSGCSVGASAAARSPSVARPALSLLGLAALGLRRRKRRA